MLELGQGLLDDLRQRAQLQSQPVLLLPQPAMLHRQMCALHLPKRTFSCALTGFREVDGHLPQIRSKPWTLLDGKTS